MTKDVRKLIKEYEEEIELGNVTRQRKRFLESQIEELQKTIVPTSLEVYCSLNPEADECREYDV